MEIQFFGANCIKVVGKKGTVVVDDTLENNGLKNVGKAGDILLFTSKQTKDRPEAKLSIDLPGEYEVADISIVGIAARSHMDEESKKSATMYKITLNDLRVAVVGHIHPDLTDDQLEALGIVDVLVIPVGGNGYTLDGQGAHEVIKEVEPKMVIPTHYSDKAIKFEVPQNSLDDALKSLGMEVKERTAKLKVKSSEFGEGTELVVLERQ